jgi:hypothetical protein
MGVDGEAKVESIPDLQRIRGVGARRRAEPDLGGAGGASKTGGRDNRGVVIQKNKVAEGHTWS